MKLLIVKLHAIGDLVIITPLFRVIRECLPNATIDIMTLNSSEPVIRENPYLNNIFILRETVFIKPNITTIIDTLKIFHNLRNNNYDAAVIFHHNIFIKYFVKLIGIKINFSFANINSKYKILLHENRHSFKTAYELMRLALNYLNDGNEILSRKTRGMKYEIFLSKYECEFAHNLLNIYGLEQKGFIIILPGGGVSLKENARERRWPPLKYAELVDKLYQLHKTKIVLIGGSSDISTCDIITSNSKGEIYNFSGKLDLRISSAVMSMGKIIVSNDSGPLHIASAFSIPTIGIFGPTGARIKQPFGNVSKAVCTGIPCSPCYFGKFKNCIYQNIKCLQEMDVDTVYKEIKFFL